MNEKLAEQIKKLVPKELNQFPKLTMGCEPCRFDKWALDREGRECLYYVVTGGKREYKKRVLLQELIQAINWFDEAGRRGYLTLLTRENFERLCPITNRDGSCGYPVVLSIADKLRQKEI